MAQEELILTDDLFKDIKKLEEGVKDFSKSLKKLGIESKSLQKDLNKISDVSGTVMKAFATGDIDKAIDKISTASKLTVGWEKYLENLGKGGVTEMKALGEILEKIVNTMNNLKPNTAIEDTIEAQKKDLIAMQNVNGATITPIDPKKKSWDFAKDALKVNKKDAKSIAGLEEQINHLSIAQENLIGSGKRYEQTITKISDLIDKKKTKIQDLTRTTEKQNQIEEKARKTTLAQEEAYRKVTEASIERFRSTTQGALSFSSNAKTYKDQEQAIKYLTTARENLSKTDSNYEQTLRRLNDEIERNKREMKNATKSSSDLAREEEQARIQQEKAYQQRRKRILAERELVHKQINQSYDGSLRFSDNAKTINDRAKAIENMRKAYNKLDPSVETNKVKMARLNLEIKKQESALRRLQGETAKTSNAMGQWASRLGALFGINAISNFVRKMVTVRGEFELQQKSLEVLLKSKSEANKLWEQTMQLAVKSPFQVGQLITYTKQLAAYQIETDKLFDTTKRLADLSAGLGVDMDRLILAYGQVRTAEYLRATEVRQFTEAGVPLLDALAKRFEALEGKSVSVAEVMERITKRQVTFGDVEAVINQMTDLGGLFYNMQEEQSKTVKGMMSNLKDEISLMFNEIGESSEGAIKRSLQVVRWLVQHWEAVGVVLTGLISSLGVYKLAMLASNYALEKNVKITNFWGTSLLKNEKIVKRFGKSLPLVANGLNRMQLAFKGVGMAMKKFLPAAILVGITELVFWLANIGDAAEEAQEKIDEGLRESIKELNKLSIKFFDEKDLESQKQNLKSLIEFYEDAFGEGLDIEINNLNSEEIIAKFNELNPIIEEQLQFNAKVGYNFEDLSDKALSDGIREDIKDLEASSLKLEKNLTDLIYSTDKLTDKERIQWNDKIKNAKTYNDYLKIAYDLNKKTNEGKYGIIGPDLMEARNEFNEFFKSIEPRLQGLTKGEKEIKIKAMLNELALKEQWNDFTKWLAFDLANKTFKINITPEVKIGPEQLPDLMQWQDDFNAKLASFQDKAGITSINTVETTAEKKINELSGLLTEIEKDIERKKANARDLANTSLSTLENQRNTIKEMLAFLGVINAPKKGGGRKAESIVPKQIEEIKKAFEEWDKLNDYWDNTASATSVVDAMTESLGALNVQLGKQDGFLTFNGQIVRTKRELADLLGSMANKATNQKDRRLFLQAQASLQVEFDQDDAKREFEKVIKEIDDQIAGYELFSELKDLNVGIDIKDLAGIFKVETKSLEDIHKGLINQLGALPAGNEEERKKIAEKINQVEEMQNKERKKRLKEYTKMLEKTMEDNLKVHYDYYKALGQIEQDRRNNVITNDFANALKNQLDQQYKEQKDKVAWEDFTGSDDYIRLFEDMDNVSTKALKDMRERLLGLRESLKNLPPDQLKEIVKAIDDLDDKINERNPFKSFAVWGDAFSGSIKKSKQEIEKLKNGLNNVTIDFNGEKREYKGVNLTDLSKETKIYEEEIGKLEGLSKAGIPINEERLGWLRDSLAINKLITKELEKQLKDEEESIKNKKEQWQQSLQTLSELGGGIESLSGNLGSMLEQFGASDAIGDTVASIGEIGGAIGGMAGGIAGVIANPANIGAWVQAIGGFMDTITAIGGASDKSKQREIEDLQDHIDSLAKSYEELSEAMDMAYSMDRMSNAYRMAQANIEAQKKAIKEQIKLEKEKWNTDKEKVKEYEEQLEELDKQSEDLKQQLIDSMGGITDTSSKAREFVDAWVDAFKETGDGLSGLEENFDEFFDNLIREQISKQVIGSITQRFAEEVNKAIMENGDSGEITDVEWRQLQQLANASKEQMNNAMQMYRQFFEESGAGLSGLQEGIKGITESQADIIASYLNSIRMFVSEKTSYAREIRNILMGINGQPNPMLDELKRVARHTENIRDLLLKVSDPISNTLKVSIY